MAGKSPVTVDEEQRQGLLALSHSRDRGEADRARAILLTVSGWTSRQIAEAFGVRKDTVRFWRSAFMTGGIEALSLYRIEQVWPGLVSPLQPRVPVVVHTDDPAQHMIEIYRSLERTGVTIPIRLEIAGQRAG